VALQLTGVTFTYGAGTEFAQPALADVDLTIVPGSVTLIAGPTGSGKSTLLRIAAGLIPLQAGHVDADQRDSLEGLTGARDGIGLVFQFPETQLFGETVIEDVAFGPRHQGLDHASAEEIARQALQRVGLPPGRFANRSPFSLSGGEARRAALAGVIALAPRYLLLDEPTAGLDPEGREAVLAVIDEVRDDVGVAVVSHDLEGFLGHADRALILSEGRPAFFGRADQVVQEPEVLGEVGLVVPDILRVQLAARRHGIVLERLTMDAEEAGAAIAAAGGWSA